ncbi:M1 family metallopeptidase [Gaetbulibacter aquiaggeris]|uniref:Aminopeptidase N n=1 Tax=Gaetbulibacter aquiaggeris TaxID=1735373 RepID=A0ABW7MSM6_9FLAO
MKLKQRSFKQFLFIVFIFNCSFLYVSAQNHDSRFQSIDILNYNFHLTLTDESNEIDGLAEITIKFKKSVTSFDLDLVEQQSNNIGMKVDAILENNLPIIFKHNSNQLLLNIPESKTNDIRIYTIKYHGIPTDGLIISKNKYGDRTFFGDNWPDRAKNWLPVVDHPSDKATVEWDITAPSHYQTIGNGTLIERTNLDRNTTLTRWKMQTPIPVKVMVIGVAQFAVENLEEIYNIPVSSWVYPQDRVHGFKDYALAVPVLDFMINHVGPYPFEKLANVQSKTLFGGMENAGNIFYNEKSVTGNGDYEAVIAHEIAHQWFGDSASELNWHHVWLSEGFATYFENLFYENRYGRDSFVRKLKEDRLKALQYYNKNQSPIIDTTVTDYAKLLSPHTYEKASWVLHMLRKKLGDKLFWEGIKTYYDTYKYSNALSEDFQHVMELISGSDLNSFFKQWLYQSGHPILDIVWNTTARLNIEIKQTQENLFLFPVDLKINFEDGSSSIETIDVNDRLQKITFPKSKNISSMEIDPNTWLFFDLNSIKKE